MSCMSSVTTKYIFWGSWYSQDIYSYPFQSTWLQKLNYTCTNTCSQRELKATVCLEGPQLGFCQVSTCYQGIPPPKKTPPLQCHQNLLTVSTSLIVYTLYYDWRRWGEEIKESFFHSVSSLALTSLFSVNVPYIYPIESGPGRLFPGLLSLCQCN